MAALVELPSPPSSRDAAPAIRILLSTCPVQSLEGKEHFFVPCRLFDIQDSGGHGWPFTGHHVAAHSRLNLCMSHAFLRHPLLLGRGVEREKINQTCCLPLRELGVSFARAPNFV